MFNVSSEYGTLSYTGGTGGNIEITHFRVNPTGHGHGTRLLIKMLEDLKSHPPYHTVYGFTRTSNIDARRAYEAMGFDLSIVSGVYKDGTAVVFSAPYSDLCAKHLKDPDA